MSSTRILAEEALRLSINAASGAEFAKALAIEAEIELLLAHQRFGQLGSDRARAERTIQHLQQQGRRFNDSTEPKRTAA